MSSPWAAAAAPLPPDEWAPAGALPTAAGPGGHAYPSAEEWVARWLARTYRRSVATQHRAWCPQWWAHPEALSTLTGLWGAWEVARAGEEGAMAEWWLTAHVLMDRLLDPAGPFQGCSAEKGHAVLPLPALPTDPPPAGWAAEDTSGADPAPE